LSFKSANALKSKYFFILRDKKNYEHFIWMIQGVFIPVESCCFHKTKKSESPLLLVILMEDKYLLNNINEIVSMVDLYRSYIHL
jgi:hypothetical protein